MLVEVFQVISSYSMLGHLRSGSFYVRSGQERLILV
jgi:hypothetical protein